MLKESSSSISWGVFLIKMRPLHLTSSGWNLQRRKWSHIKHMFYLRNKCIKFSKYFARKKAFIFEIVSVYCVLEMASVSSLYHYFRFLDLVGLMSTNVKYIFVLEHKPKIILYRRSYLQTTSRFLFFCLLLGSEKVLIWSSFCILSQMNPILRPFKRQKCFLRNKRIRFRRWSECHH